jgi:hypothetical protein
MADDTQLERLRRAAESADRGEGIKLTGLSPEVRRAILSRGTVH